MGGMLSFPDLQRIRGHPEVAREQRRKIAQRDGWGSESCAGDFRSRRVDHGEPEQHLQETIR